MVRQSMLQEAEMWIEGIDVLVTVLSIGLGLVSLWLSWSVGQEVWLEKRQRK